MIPTRHAFVITYSFPSLRRSDARDILETAVRKRAAFPMPGFAAE